jgi:hypothetical protein
LRRKNVAVEGNHPIDLESEEAILQHAINLSRAEHEYRQGVDREVVHMRMEGVAVLHGGILWRGCCEEQLRIGRVLR